MLSVRKNKQMGQSRRRKRNFVLKRKTGLVWRSGRRKFCFEAQDWPCLAEWGGGNWWQRLSGKEESYMSIQENIF
jgi:hypothetical protein